MLTTAGATRSTTSAKEFCDARPELGAAVVLLFGVFVVLGGATRESLRSGFVPHAVMASKQRAGNSWRIITGKLLVCLRRSLAQNSRDLTSNSFLFLPFVFQL